MESKNRCFVTSSWATTIRLRVFQWLFFRVRACKLASGETQKKSLTAQASASMIFPKHARWTRQIW